MEEKPVTIEQMELETQGRYQFQKILGRGAYGIVFKAKDKKLKKHVAVKRVERIFETTLDAKRCLREICILSRLNHENITNLIDVTALNDFNKFDSLIVVMDIMETDLYKIISSNQPLSVDHHRFFIYQVLRGLKYIHSANVLHRDLKPSNILVNSNCDIKIGDFGLARISERNDDSDFLSEYVATRWYRSPEVLLNYGTYGPALDVWSVGCILAELILRKPLFPGSTPLNQIELIVNILGSPSEEDLAKCPNRNARRFVKSLGSKKKVPWAQVFKGKEYNKDEIDLLEKMLTWDPDKRITVEEALEHPFMEEMHDPTDEPVTFPIEEFEFERADIKRRELKNLIWKEVLTYHPEFANDNSPSKSSQTSPSSSKH